MGELFSGEHTSYRARAEMESDPSFKQLIPYVIFRSVAGGQTQLFQYTRGKGQGEKRLHANRSIGIGGHICAEDDSCDHDRNPYQEGMRRELGEEVIIETPYREQVVGLINDDLTEVGKVHLGVVHIFDVETPDVESREADILDAGFRPLQELLRESDKFESWSQICLDALFRQQ